MCGDVCTSYSFLLFNNKKIYNAGTIFLGYWAIIVFLASLNLDNAAPVGQSSYGLILLELISFAVGCFFVYISSISQE